MSSQSRWNLCKEQTSPFKLSIRQFYLVYSPLKGGQETLYRWDETRVFFTFEIHHYFSLCPGTSIWISLHSQVVRISRSLDAVGTSGSSELYIDGGATEGHKRVVFLWNQCTNCSKSSHKQPVYSFQLPSLLLSSRNEVSTSACQSSVLSFQVSANETKHNQPEFMFSLAE